MTITPSKEQIDVFHHINNSDKNLIVSAVAGSGKTTTLLEALSRIPEKKSVLFMAFNRAINDELVKRAPKRANIMIKTVHGFGFNMLLEYDKDIKTNFYKYNNIFRNVLDFIKDGNIEIIRKYDFKTPELKLIEKLKTIINDNFEVDPEFNVDEYGTRVIDLCDIARLYNVGSREKKKLNELAEHHSILNACKEAESTIILMRLGTYHTKEIDFTDMIYLPNVLNLSCPTFDYVFIDECLPKSTNISTIIGNKKIGELYNMFMNGQELPMVITYNEQNEIFENKKIKKIWSNGVKEVYYVTLNGKRKLKSTINHKFLTQRGWVRLDELRIGDGIASNSYKQPYHPMPNDIQKDIIVGSILGDGNFERISDFVMRLRVIHGEAQKNYLMWKAKVFNSKIEYILENGMAKKPAYRFQTIGYYSYINKDIAIQELNERSLAIAWMDDGSLAKNELSSTLHSFSNDLFNITKLNNAILNKFNIKGKICTTKSSTTGNICYYILFNKEMTNKISLCVSPYIHKDMKYKIKKEHQLNIIEWGEYIEPNIGYLIVTKPHQFYKKEEVLDISINDNHNFITTSSSRYGNAKNYGLITHNCQDLNVCQKLIMLKAINKGGKFIAVGDPGQCQPDGTKILKSSGELVNIEDIKIGDHVVSYDRRTGHYVGFGRNNWSNKNIERYGVKVNNIKRREFDGLLYKITSSTGKVSKYTENHKTLVKFNNHSLTGYFLYLMEKNGMFRIGITSVWDKSGKKFGTFRAKQEKADKFWILNYYESQNLAYIDEQYYSVAYSIPQMRFNHRGQSGILNQDMIDLYYSRFNKSKMYHNSVLLLKKFMKNIDYPFWDRSKINYFSKTHMFEIYACNLIPIIMDVVDFDENNFKSISLKEKRIKVTFKQLINIEYENYIGYVNSLDVDKHKLYLADGILTHNSIYGFAGADSDSYKNLCKIPNTEQLPLSTTFRCPNKVIELVRPLNSQIQPFESNPEGEIIEDASYKDIKDGDMILCRQAFPVVSLCMRYLSQGKSAYIIGSDIGKSLISMITRNERKTEEYIMENVFARLDKEYDKIVEKLMTSHKLTQKEAENQTTSVSFREKIMAIESIAGDLRDPNEVIMKINNMFSDNNKNGICLSTIHKAKGLENDRVFILMPDLMPSQYAKEDWEHIQEDNLRYVAYTRAKKVLGFITDYDAYTTRMNSPRSKTVVKDSKHIGIVGEFKYLTLKVVNIRNIKTQFGDTKLYEMVDEDGNLFKKWGDIKARYITGSGFTINIDTKLAFMGKIKSHGEYQGIKETIIGSIM